MDVREIPWVEKYRPTSLKEVASQTLTIQSLQEFVNKQSIPHLIFTGPAGTGKTSAAMSLIYDLLGKKNLTQDVILERNASDESRMQDLPSIKNFVNHTGINQDITFKFVILDEADNLSKDVQSAFRRIIEQAPPNVKFIFMCNYVERIIDPILSRCAIFRFYPLPRHDFETQLLRIAHLENIPLKTDIIDAIYYISQGDMRQAINLFQMIVSLLEDEQGKINNYEINPDTIYQISGFLSQSQLNALMKFCLNLQFEKTLQEIRQMKGISSRGLFRQIMTTILAQKIKHPKLEKIMIALAEYDYRLTLQANPTIQLDGFFADLIQILGE